MNAKHEGKEANKKKGLKSILFTELGRSFPDHPRPHSVLSPYYKFQ